MRVNQLVAHQPLPHKYHTITTAHGMHESLPIKQTNEGIFYRVRSNSQKFQNTNSVHLMHGQTGSRSISNINICGLNVQKNSGGPLESIQLPQIGKNVPQSSKYPAVQQPTRPAQRQHNFQMNQIKTSRTDPSISNSNFIYNDRSNSSFSSNDAVNKIKGYNLNNNRQDVYFFARSASADLSKLIQSTNKKLLYSRLSENRLNIGKQQQPGEPSPPILPSNYEFSSKPFTFPAQNVERQSKNDSIQLKDTLKEFEELAEKTKAMKVSDSKEESPHNKFKFLFKPKFNKLTSIFKTTKMYSVDEQNSNSGSDGAASKCVPMKYTKYDTDFCTSQSLPSLVLKKLVKSDGFSETPSMSKDINTMENFADKKRKKKHKLKTRRQFVDWSEHRLKRLSLDPPKMIGGSFDNLYMLNKLSKNYNNNLPDSYVTYHGKQQSHKKIKQSLYKYRRPSENSDFPSDDTGEMQFVEEITDPGNISDESSLFSTSNDDGSSSSAFAIRHHYNKRPHSLSISASLNSVPLSLSKHDSHMLKKYTLGRSRSPTVASTPTNVRSKTPSIADASTHYYTESNYMSHEPSPIASPNIQSRCSTPTTFIYPIQQAYDNNSSYYNSRQMNPSNNPSNSCQQPKLTMRNNSLPTSCSSSSFHASFHHIPQSQTHPNLYLQHQVPAYNGGSSGSGVSLNAPLFNYPLQQVQPQQFLNYNIMPQMMHQPSSIPPSPIIQQQQQKSAFIFPFQTTAPPPSSQQQNFIFHSNPSLKTPQHIQSSMASSIPPSITSMTSCAASQNRDAYSLVSSQIKQTKETRVRGDGF